MLVFTYFNVGITLDIVTIKYPAMVECKNVFRKTVVIYCEVKNKGISISVTNFS